ncbi:MAG: phage major capsid protein [Victivallales bacterium]|nr:phage major capsid protein [Victivallales bacterium]
MKHTDIQDLVMSVIDQLPPADLVQIAQELRDYHVFPTLFKGSGDKLKVVTAGGTECVFDALVKKSQNARNVGLYEPDTVSAIDGLAKGQVPWRHTQVSYLFEDHEIAMNADPHQLVNLIKLRREQAMLGLADLLEANFFGKPENADDAKTPWGLFYWLVKSTAVNSATSNCGFNGGAPSGFSNVAGLSPSTYPQWKNYVAPYYSVGKFSDGGTLTDGDFIPHLRRCFEYTNWKSPLGGEEMGKTFGQRFKLFTNFELQEQVEKYLEDKNELLFKADLAPLYGKTTFRGVPFFSVPFLDNDSSNPVYGVNTDTFEFRFLKGFKMRESEVKDAPNQHNVSIVFCDNSYNLICYDRRRNFVMNKVANYAA